MVTKGIPTQIQNLLRWLTHYHVNHSLKLTKSDNWYIDLPNMPFNVMAYRKKPGIRGFRLVGENNDIFTDVRVIRDYILDYNNGR